MADDGYDLLAKSYDRLLSVMQAAVIASWMGTPDDGMAWIEGCLEDPGILPGPDDEGGNWDGNESAQDFYSRQTRPPQRVSTQPEDGPK